MPILIIHSQGDMLYPYSQGELLFERANEPKQFLEVYGDHGEGALVSRDIYVKGVEKFLSSTSIQVLKLSSSTSELAAPPTP